MINKENILFCIVGLLAGAIIGFVFANSLNQSATQQPAGGTTSAMAGMPGGHPPTAGGSDGSMVDIQAAIEKARNEPDNFDAQIKAAEVYYQIQRFESAIEFLQRANKIKPNDFDTIVNLANAYFDSNRYDDAEKTYIEALAIKPDEVAVRTDLGLTYVVRQQPDYDKAIKEFSTALEKDPKNAMALQNLTIAYTKKGDAAKANEAVARLETADPSNDKIAKLKEEISKIQAK
ncbi:MAG: tetratricopeptide repeat protein [Pyrinomonadaceae bacterium]|nr:tetratricopeptide repeat protein [Pyrinomonadaceae bacterium]